MSKNKLPLGYRGGAWCDAFAAVVRAARCVGYTPTSREVVIGFRTALKSKGTRT